MLNFPLPENEELLYSVIARAGIIAGEPDSIPLLKMVFGHHKLIATVDLPSNIETIAKNYHESCNLPSNNLIYKHTLFPIYAPFIEEQTRRKVIEWMKYSNSGAAQTATGRCASNVKAKKELMVCPDCLQEQLAEKGTVFLKRSWMVPGIRHCLKHGDLFHTGIELGKDARHAFKPLPIELACNITKNSKVNTKHQIICGAVDKLLLLPETSSPTFNQWSCYYNDLGVKYGVTRGKQVDHSIISAVVLSHWGEDFLRDIGLVEDPKEIQWLTNIFRKHRKSFSFLQHIVVLDALAHGWSWKKLLSDVKRYPSAPQKVKKVEYQKVDLTKRKEWEIAVKKYGIKGAKENGFGGLQTWLYRHDAIWYNEFSKKNSLPKCRPNNRVDWQQRDNELCEALKHKLSKYDLVFIDRQITRSWMMNLLGCKPMIEKNLEKLPILTSLFNQYTESTSDFQIRRVNKTLGELKLADESVAEWKLLRFSKLSKDRVKAETSIYIAKVLYQEGCEDTIKHCSL